VDLKLIRALALRAGRTEDVPFRAVIGCLLAAVRSGGLRIPAEPGPLAARLEAFLRDLHANPLAYAASRDGGFAAAAEPDLAAVARALAESFHAARLSGAYAALIGTPPDFMPLLHSGRSLYFQKHQAAEAAAGIRLASLLAAPDREVSPDTARNLLDTVLAQHPLRLGRGPEAPAMEFRGGQRIALAMGLRKRLLVVSGGPGTGKTSLVANLLRALVRLPGREKPLRIRLAAPTGRAAQRLSDALRASLGSIAHGTGKTPDEREAALDGSLASLSGETLHRLLGYRPGRGEYHHRPGRPVPADLVVVDEASMVDIFSLSRLLGALEEGATLVLLGDMDQLPSVEAGAVLADLAPGPGAFTLSPSLRTWLEACLPGEPLPPHAGPSPLRDHLVLLDRSHRSDAGILEVTRALNAQAGREALAAMAPPFPLPASSGPGPWTLAFMDGGRKSVPGGGCRFIDPAPDETSPSGVAGHAGGEAPGHARALPRLLESWAAFHYLEHAQDPACHPGRTLAAPRRASYAALLGRLAAAPPASVRTAAPSAGEASSAGRHPPGPDGQADPEWAADLDDVFAYLDQARILAFTRKGWHGSASINRRLRDRLAPLWDPQAWGAGREDFHGAPILIQENDYAQDLFNGEVGVVLRIRGRYLAWFRKEEGYRAFAAHALPRHELAFATTVHKAQGSEYDQVLVVLPEAGNRLLFKETLYTAITRARHFAGIYGPREVFLEAAGRKVDRESGLAEFLSGAAEASPPATG
jgi:exodeoxyribonuclease V alpha subunit